MTQLLTPPKDDDALVALTPREREVLELMAEGKNTLMRPAAPLVFAPCGSVRSTPTKAFGSGALLNTRAALTIPASAGSNLGASASMFTALSAPPAAQTSRPAS